MSDLIQWSERPERACDVPDIKLERVNLQSSDFWFVNNHIEGLHTHYVEEKTWPCLKFPHCQPCHNGRKRRWVGYAYVLSSTGYRFMLELTQKSHDSLEKAVKDVKALRGIRGYLKREKPQKNSKLFFHLCANQKQVDLPPEVDLRPILKLIWGTDRINFIRHIVES